MVETTTPRRRAAFTVLELIVAMALLGSVIGAATIALLKIQRDYAAQRTTTEARETIRSVEMILQRVFRSARANPRNITVPPVAIVVNPLNRTGSSWDNVTVRADFNPTDGSVAQFWEDVQVELTADTIYLRHKAGSPKEAIAYPVSSLRFQFYALNGTELTDAATAGTQARRVKVTIGVPVPRTSTTLSREIWIFLRNT